MQAAVVGVLCLWAGAIGAATAAAATHKPARRTLHRKLHPRIVAAPKSKSKSKAKASPRAPVPNAQVKVQQTPVVPAVCPNADLVPSSANLAVVAQAAICLINQARLAGGLVPLSESPALDRAAAHHTSDMVAAGYLDHVSPSGETMQMRVLASGYVPSGSGYALGENIAVGSAGVDSASQTVANWMANPAHRANIMDPEWRDTGLAVSPGVPASFLGGQPGSTFTEEFGVIDGPS